MSLIKLIISPLAARDIESIADYIALDNPKRAITFIDELIQQCEKTTQFPEIYYRRPEIHPDIRICLYRRYLIMFKLDDATVRIERLIHSARNLDFLFS